MARASSSRELQVLVNYKLSVHASAVKSAGAADLSDSHMDGYTLM